MKNAQNSDARAQILAQAEQSISLSKPALARSLISKLTKSGPLTPNESIHVSEIYRTLSENDKAIKILGPELSPSELLGVSSEFLALQFRLAYMLQFIGVRFMAKRMFDNLTSEVKRRQLDPLKISPFYWRYMTGLYLGINDFEKAKDAAMQAASSLMHDRKEWRGSIICQAAALFALKEREECESVLLQLMQQSLEQEELLRGQIHQRLADLYLDWEKWPQALQHCQAGEKILKNSTSTDYIFIYRSLGIYHTLNGDSGSATTYLNKCQDISTWSEISPNIKMTVYYWLERNMGERLPLEKRLATRGHLAFSPYSYNLGKCYTQRRLPLRLFYDARYDDNDHDCWLIQDEKIKAAKYSNIIRNYPISDYALLDLYSGVVSFKKSLAPPLTLTQTQVKCISPILGSGEIGMSKWALIDFIYRQDFFNPLNGEERLKNLISNLKKAGFNIRREANRYYMKLPKDQITIIPMDHQLRGAHKLFASISPSFKRGDLEATFGIGSSTAKAWIKNWMELKIIDSHGSGKNIFYRFISNED